MRAGAIPRAVVGIEAAYFVATGLWPLVHRTSFERATGKKEDFWLVRTVGGLAVAAGLSMGVAAAQRSKPPQAVVLGLATGLVFTLADLRAARTESRLYLADAVFQVAFAPAWLRRW